MKSPHKTLNTESAIFIQKIKPPPKKGMLGKKSMSMQKFSQYTILYSANISMAGCLVELRAPQSFLIYPFNYIKAQ